MYTVNAAVPLKKCCVCVIGGLYVQIHLFFSFFSFLLQSGMVLLCLFAWQIFFKSIHFCALFHGGFTVLHTLAVGELTRFSRFKYLSFEVKKKREAVTRCSSGITKEEGKPPPPHNPSCRYMRCTASHKTHTQCTHFIRLHLLLPLNFYERRHMVHFFPLSPFGLCVSVCVCLSVHTGWLGTP